MYALSSIIELSFPASPTSAAESFEELDFKEDPIKKGDNDALEVLFDPLLRGVDMRGLPVDLETDEESASEMIKTKSKNFMKHTLT